MQYRSLLSSLSKIGGLRQSNHFGAIFALSSSLVLAACGGGGSTVTENDLAEPGADGVAPSLTMVEAYNTFNKSSIVGVGDTLAVKFTADEGLMTPIVTIGGVEVEASGSVTAWSASRTMTDTDMTGPVAITIEFSDISGEAGATVSAVTEGDAAYFCGSGCAVGPGGVIQTVIDLEAVTGSYTFTDFGPDSQTSAVVQDPTDATNTVVASEKKAGAEVWGGTSLVVGGTSFQLSSEDGVMSMRLWSPEAGKTVRLKLETEVAEGPFVEADALTTGSEAWETLTFDFSIPAGGSIDPAIEYTKVSVFYDYGAAGTGADVAFYWDDVTYGGLVNDNAPTIAGRWKVVSEVGSAGVGPSAGDVAWWNLGAGDLVARACFLDDVYVLGDDGSFALELGAETWIENWQSGADDACGTPIAPHDGTSTSYSYTFADNTLTVNGSGAYIGIPKAGNTYAQETGGVPTSIEYSVVSLNNSYTEMTIAVQVTKDDGGIDFWTYKLAKEVPPAIAGRWLVANEVGSAGVGPSAGDVAWWNLGAGDLTARACFLDDVYVLGDDGSFALELGAETWIENWQSGTDDACGTPMAPHDGTSSDYTYTYADNTLTVNGSGAYIGIPKAGNTYAQESGGVPASIVYSVVSLSADLKEMTIAVEVTKDDGGTDFWTYKLVKEAEVVPPAIAGRWLVANEVGSAGVGPSAGDVAWWNLGAGDLTARACFLDDVYVLGADGSFALELGSETWLENWQSGADDACGTPMAPHDGTSSDYTYTYADNTLTVNGSGAYIGIPKAGNTYAQESGGVPASIVYSVVSLSADLSEMTIAVEVTKDDGGIDFWTYKLVKEVEFVAPPIAGRWQVANEVGSAGVGPSAGDVAWWNLGAGDLTARACFLDDVYVLGADGSFALELGAETWIENWQSGADDACGTPMAPHDGTSSSYTYTYTDNSITVNGSGAYIGIPKAGNTYAQESGGVPTSIEYSVVSLNVDNTAMTIAVQTIKDDAGIDFWTYNLVKVD